MTPCPFCTAPLKPYELRQHILGCISISNEQIHLHDDEHLRLSDFVE